MRRSHPWPRGCCNPLLQLRTRHVYNSRGWVAFFRQAVVSPFATPATSQRRFHANAEFPRFRKRIRRSHIARLKR